MASFVTNHERPYEALTSFIASKPLAGKTVLVTGASKGVGAHITEQIAAAGASRIGILGRDKTRIEAAKEKFSAAYPQTAFESFAVDITDEPAVTSLFATFGVPDILINNAGHFPDEGPFVKQDLKAWFTGFEINILGTAIVTQQFLRAKGPQKKAVVLNVSSMAAHMRFPLKGWAGYTGSKAGQSRIFEYIRFEHPETRFINIHPGQIESDGFSRSGAPEPEWGMTEGSMAGQFYAWAATDEAEFLSGRFAWAEWDIEELKKKKDEILEQDLLLSTIDGFDRGF